MMYAAVLSLILAVPLQDPGQREFAAAVQYFQRGLYYEAEKQFRRAAEFVPGNGQVWHGIAMCLYHTRKYEESLACYVKAENSNAPEAQFFCNHGVVLEVMGRPREALRLFGQAMKLDPKYVNAWFNAGRANARLGNRKLGRTQLERAVKLVPEHEQSHYELGQLLFREGDLAAAEKCALRAMELNSGSFSARHLLARVLFKQGKTAAAMKLSAEAREMQEASSRRILRDKKISGLLNIAFGLLGRNKIREGLAYLEEVLVKYDPRNASALNALKNIRAHAIKIGDADLQKRVAGILGALKR